MLPYAPIFELTRGETVESIHFGAIAIVDAHGQLVAWYGDPQAVTYLRSSAKPIQVMPFLEHGGQATFGLTPREIAILCASHSGTDEHVAVLKSIQTKTGAREADLMCGIHPLSHTPTIAAMQQRSETLTFNRHNCSGKHTGMVAHAILHGLPVADYINPAHPIQGEIRQTFAEMCGLSVEQVKYGTDGCSAPNFAVPLQNAAFAFARLCDPGDLLSPRNGVCQTITAAMTANPDMVGGPDSFDTHLMNTTGGRIICKGGAEGYQALGLLPGALGPGSPALGIAFKISDGDLKGHSRPEGDPRGHARPAVALEILRQLKAISISEMQALAEFGPAYQVYNWRKLLVGEARPCFTLNVASSTLDA